MNNNHSCSNGHNDFISDNSRSKDLNLVEKTVFGLHESLAKRVRQWVSTDVPILDIGCGSGAWLKRLADEGFEDLYGVDADISQVCTDVGKFTQVDLDVCKPWDFLSKNYRLITAIEVIEHLINIGHLLYAVSELLHPNGLFLLTTPNIHSLACRMRFLFTGKLKQFGNIGDRTHLFPVILSTFPRSTTRYDLEVNEIWGYPDDGRTLTSRSFVNLGTRIMRNFLPEVVPGDTLCMLLHKKKAL